MRSVLFALRRWRQPVGFGVGASAWAMAAVATPVWSCNGIRPLGRGRHSGFSDITSHFFPTGSSLSAAFRSSSMTMAMTPVTPRLDRLGLAAGGSATETGVQSKAQAGVSL